MIIKRKKDKPMIIGNQEIQFKFIIIISLEETSAEDDGAGEKKVKNRDCCRRARDFSSSFSQSSIDWPRQIKSR